MTSKFSRPRPHRFGIVFKIQKHFATSIDPILSIFFYINILILRSWLPGVTPQCVLNVFEHISLVISIIHLFWKGSY